MGSLSPDQLKQLAADHAPPAPGVWPLAPGWWLVAALVLAILAGAVYGLRNPRLRLRREAIRELRQLGEQPLDDVVLARRLEDLMRRYAVARFGLDRVARLSGQSWIDFLALHGADALAGDAGRQFLGAVYGGHSDSDRRLWLKSARAFIRTRR